MARIVGIRCDVMIADALDDFIDDVEGDQEPLRIDVGARMRKMWQ